MAVLLYSNFVFAKNNCFKESELKGRHEMVQKFIHGQSQEAIKLFEEFCKINADKVTCLTKTAPSAEQKAATTEIMNGKPCGQLSPIKNMDNTVTLYFFDSQKK